MKEGLESPWAFAGKSEFDARIGADVALFDCNVLVFALVNTLLFVLVMQPPSCVDFSAGAAQVCTHTGLLG